MTVEHHHKDEALIVRSYKSVLQSVKKVPPRAAWLIAVVVLLVAVLVGSWFYFTTSATAAASAVWLSWWENAQTSSPADLDKFAKDAAHQGTIQARFARAEAADRRMQEAVPHLGAPTPADRAEAVAQINEARTAYEDLVKESGDAPALMQQCLMGAAKANEVLGDLDKAKQFYQQLAHDHAATALGKEAEARVKALDDDNAKATMAALAHEYAPQK
jgi:hypothetical protein